eukprot:CAMPEP_0117459274 /NCGR_PEP_ID=MMETSP0784-20121206/1386_1 /TAXON_ID=39447 /ORGANISM="" /LENGTH=539 /DNA_ID=CAMNT_0005252867 /DNA_START=878 /DNA_END=2494 /DNA_ORIENTATION=+
MPWRSKETDFIDASITLCFILVVGLSPFSVENADVTTVGFAAVVVVSGWLILAPMPTFFKLGNYFYYRRRKPYRYFLCHHKAHAGAFTRLLYMQLKGNMGTRVFLDWEDLSDLDKLFDYVRSAVDTLVVICSVGIVQRPYCMGEITTAHANSIETILVGFPYFELPERSFIENYESLCPSASMLFPFGITIDRIQAALSWMRSLPKIDLPSTFGPSVVPMLADKILANDFTTLIDVIPEPATLKRLHTAIIVDYSNWEAVASAQILLRYLVAVSPDVQHVPVLVGQSEDGKAFEAGCSNLLVVCTGSAWRHKEFLTILVHGVMNSKRSVAICAETGFHIPGDAFYTKLEADLSFILGPEVTELSPRIVSMCVQALFSEIAVEFAPQSPAATGAVLEVRANQIEKRLRMKRRNKTLSFGTLQDNVVSAVPDQGEKRLSMSLPVGALRDSTVSSVPDQVAERLRVEPRSKTLPVGALQGNMVSLVSDQVKEDFGLESHLSSLSFDALQGNMVSVTPDQVEERPRVEPRWKTLPVGALQGNM